MEMSPELRRIYSVCRSVGNMDELMHLECQNCNLFVPWYLITSYAYYVMDKPVISDAKFDKMCQWMERDWEFIQHRHKHLIDRGWMKAGTCLLPEEKYPHMAKSCADNFNLFLRRRAYASSV